VATGKSVGVLKEHKQRVNSVAISPDGKLLATGSDDSAVKVWDLGDGK
jgi:WD40 repeat protein